MAASHAELPSSNTNYNEFMGFTENVKSRPMDNLTKIIDPNEVVDLAASSNIVAGIIEKEDPDIVFFPQRGAGPIQWMCEEMLEQRGVKTPLSVDIPLGTHTDVRTRLQSGLTPEQKDVIIEDVLQRLQDEGVYQPGISKLMIIDEVQKGGTITQAAHRLKHSMQKREDDSSLSVVAIQDSRSQLIGMQRAHDFKRLAANEDEGYKTFVVPTALFTVDRSQFLDIIASDLDEQAYSESPLERLKTVENQESREIFRSFARAFHAPDSGQAEMDMVKRDSLIDDLGSAVLQFAIADALTDPRDVRKRGSTRRIVAWWDEYINSVQASRALPQLQAA
jgi:hypothetical protein